MGGYKRDDSGHGTASVQFYTRRKFIRRKKCRRKLEGKTLCHFVEMTKKKIIIYRLQLVYLPKQRSAKEKTGKPVLSSNLSFLWNYSTTLLLLQSHLYFFFVNFPLIFDIIITKFKILRCTEN